MKLKTLFQRLWATRPDRPQKSAEDIAVPTHRIFTFTERLTEALAWPATDLPPLNRAVNTNTNINAWVVGPVNMSVFKRAIGKLFFGAGTATFNTTVSFLCGNTTNTSCTAITNSTVWTWVAPTNGPSVTLSGVSPNSATIEIRADQMATNTNYLALIVNNACAQLFAAELIASQADYSPASQYNCTANLTQVVM